MYTWHDGAEASTGRLKNSQIFFQCHWTDPYRFLSLEESLQRRANWLGKRQWQNSWFILMVSTFGPRSYLVYDTAAQPNAPVVIALNGSSLERTLADDLYGLFSLYVGAQQRGFITKDGYIRQNQVEAFKKLEQELNPLTAKANAQQQEIELEENVARLLRLKGLPSPSGVDNVINAALKVAKSNHPKSLQALINAYQALFEVGACESIFNLLYLEALREQSAQAIATKILAEKNPREELIVLTNQFAKEIAAMPSLKDQLVRAIVDWLLATKETSNELISLAERFIDEVDALLEEELSSKDRKRVNAALRVQEALHPKKKKKKR